MKNVLLLAGVVLMGVSTGTAADIKSGPTVGSSAGAFQVHDISGPKKGTKLCYRCAYKSRPVVTVFARKMDKNVVKLLQQLDKSIVKNKKTNMAGFVVMLTDDPDVAKAKLKKVATEAKISTNLPLTVFDGASGPAKYRIAKEADITVTMWTKSEIKKNHAFKIADLNDAAIKKVLEDTKKILN